MSCAVAHHHLARSVSHTVVMCEHTVDVGGVREYVVHGMSSARPGPFAVAHTCERDAGISLQGVGETAVAVDGRRRVLQSGYLHHAPPAAKLGGDIMSHGGSYGIVVGSDECGVFCGIGLTVEIYHRYSPVVGSVYRLRHGVNLVRRHHEQVYPAIRQTVYLGYLPPVVVVGGSDAQLYIVEEISAHAQLFVKLVTPYVLAALRHSYDISLPPGAS